MKRYIALFLCLTTLAAGAASAPRLKLDDIGWLPIYINKPYDEKADANRTVETAFARAKASGKNVLLDLGGNWCPDCIVLTNLMELPEMKPFMAAHYEVALVDVGRFDKNLQIPARFGIPKLLGVPTVLVITPEGKVLNPGDPFALSDASHMSPQAAANWLARWTP